MTWWLIIVVGLPGSNSILPTPGTYVLLEFYAADADSLFVSATYASMVSTVYECSSSIYTPGKYAATYGWVPGFFSSNSSK